MKIAQVRPKLAILWDTVVENIQGTDRVQAVVLRHLTTGRQFTEAVEGVFVYVGLAPSTAFYAAQNPASDSHYFRTDEHMRTSTPGIYAVGDVREKMLRQIVTAAADGAIAATNAEQYITEHF